jgi:hypothetical protein
MDGTEARDHNAAERPAITRSVPTDDSPQEPMTGQCDQNRGKHEHGQTEPVRVDQEGRDLVHGELFARSRLRMVVGV